MAILNGVALASRNIGATEEGGALILEDRWGQRQGQGGAGLTFREQRRAAWPEQIEKAGAQVTEVTGGQPQSLRAVCGLRFSLAAQGPTWWGLDRDRGAARHDMRSESHVYPNSRAHRHFLKPSVGRGRPHSLYPRSRKDEVPAAELGVAVAAVRGGALEAGPQVCLWQQMRGGLHTTSHVGGGIFPGALPGLQPSPGALWASVSLAV